MRKTRYKSAKALTHVMGNHLVPVMLLLISISWLGDACFTIFEQYVKHGATPQTIWDESKAYIITGAVALIILLIFWGFSRKEKHSDKFNKPSCTDNHKTERQVLIITLSTYNTFPKAVLNTPEEPALTDREQGYSLQELKDNLKNLPSDTSIPDLRRTAYQCNWLPMLQAINNYPSLTDVIVLTTSGEKGSFEQINDFRDFVNQYFRLNDKDIAVRSYLNTELMKNQNLRNAYANGLPANDIYAFATVAMEILDNVIEKYKSDKGVEEAGNRVVIDVTGGTASMSAVMAAISVSKGIFFHYTDTHSLKSQELDITAE